MWFLVDNGLQICYNGRHRSEYISGFLLARNWLIFTLSTTFALFLSAATLNHGTNVASAAVENPSVIHAATTVATATTVDQIDTPADEPIVSVEQYVKNYYSKTPILARIAKCESQYRQFATNGKVLRGREVYEDVGVMQINETYHKATSQKLGYDIYTLDGNLAYAEYLYERQGTQPWSASAPCWDR
jgi:hypothetical protein